jgi:hypothetical protein
MVLRVLRDVGIVIRYVIERERVVEMFRALTPLSGPKVRLAHNPRHWRFVWRKLEAAALTSIKAVLAVTANSTSHRRPGRFRLLAPTGNDIGGI